MCCVTGALRRLVGVRDWSPPVRKDGRMLVRMPTWYGARGNGHVARVPVDPVIDALAREHRTIRQMLADGCRMRGRG